MRVWKVLKDKGSLWQATLWRRNPDMDKAVILATSHSHRHLPLDRRNVDRVCHWLHLSPLNLKPILRSISSRMEKTHDWSVALKGLLLTHTLITCKSPSLNQIGRLPFDLSEFRDTHTSQAKAWPFNAFVRSYYAFLDQKSATLFLLADVDGGGFVMKRELEVLQKMLGLADLLVEIRPASTAALVPLVLDVMDGIIVEVYEVYSRICRGIAMVLTNIYTAEKGEAVMALHVVHRAMKQGEKLAYFFDYCREMGVIHSSELPEIDTIPVEGMYELEQIIQGFDDCKILQVELEDKLIIARKTSDVGIKGEFRTIITEEWERFDEDFVIGEPQPLLQGNNVNLEPPDLITFL